jgi:hypothetical protein
VVGVGSAGMPVSEGGFGMLQVTAHELGVRRDSLKIRSLGREV